MALASRWLRKYFSFCLLWPEHSISNMNKQPQLKPETNSENGINDSVGLLFGPKHRFAFVSHFGHCQLTPNKHAMPAAHLLNPIKILASNGTMENNSTVFAEPLHTNKKKRYTRVCYKQRYVQIGHPLSIKRMTLAEKIDSHSRMGWFGAELSTKQGILRTFFQPKMFVAWAQTEPLRGDFVVNLKHTHTE